MSKISIETAGAAARRKTCAAGSVFWLLCLILFHPILKVSSYKVDDGFISEVVLTDVNVIKGYWVDNPRQTGRKMLLLVAKEGRVLVLENPDTSSETLTILTLLPNQDICTNGERGLQSVIFHPNFAQNRYVYLFYNKFLDGCPLGDDTGTWNVLVRFTMDPATLKINMDSKQELWRGAPTRRAMHNGGAMLFGVDGKLWVTTGIGGNPDSSQPLNNVHGSVIRLNDDGTIPQDNPFTIQNGYNAYRCADTGGRVPSSASADAVCSEVFASGLRNPFRVALNPFVSDRVLFSISDVGDSRWEELNFGGSEFARVNYGYPTRNGVCPKGTGRCDPLSHLFEPYHWYEHIFIEGGGGCVSGAAYVPEGVWPSKYRFLFADFAFREIYNLIEDENAGCRECTIPTSKFRNETFYSSKPSADSGLTADNGRIADIFFGPYRDTQALYVVHYVSKESVVRIRYTGNVDNGPPLPVITLEKRNFLLGEVVSFSAAQSTDPDGDVMTYEWDFGDNNIGTGVTTSHVYAHVGEYVVTLSVTDETGQKQQAFEKVVVGTPPSAVITSPKEGEEFYVGQIFQLSGKAYDSQGLQLDDSKLSWEVRQHHADHFHPFLDPTPGNNRTLQPAPAPEDIFASTNSYLRIILTATDNTGLTTQVDRIVQPSKVTIGLNSKPRGLVITVDSYPVTTFGQIVSWEGHSLLVKAEDQGPYKFMSWSNGSVNPERRVKVRKAAIVMTANFCMKDLGKCSASKECCSRRCIANVCSSA